MKGNNMLDEELNKTAMHSHYEIVEIALNNLMK